MTPSRVEGKIITGQSLKELTMTGIYKMSHINKKGLFYIGSASNVKGVKDCKKGFYRRFLEHIHFLENKKHSSKFLQNVVNKYGIEGIRFEIIEVIDVLYENNRSFILEREQYYLDLLKPVYNTSSKASCPTVEYTDERRKAASDRRKGKKLPKSAYEKIQVKVSQYSLDNIFLETFDSIKIASDCTGIERSGISRSASGHRKTSGGFKWKFV